LDFLDHLLVRAGNPALVTDQLREVMVDHCAGNLRILTGIGAELLDEAVRRGGSQLDEKLFLEVTDRQRPLRKARRPQGNQGAA
jgi:hypothetical protein